MKKIIMNGIETQYMVSEDGKIYDPNGNEVHTIIYNGYVTVYIPDLHRAFSVARIVATMFIENNNPDYTIVVHRDHNPFNNTVSNLEWALNGHWDRSNLPKGGASPNAKHTDKQALQVCKLLMNPDMSLSDIANTVGCTKNFVYDIYREGGWKHISSRFNFPERNPQSHQKGYITAILKKDGTESGYTVSRSGYVRGPDGKKLKRILNKNGYYYVEIDRSVGLKYWGKVLVHVLVADEFISKPSGTKGNFKIVHIDGNKLNNNYKNLKWEI